MKYRADIDGLRSIAIVPVVLFHAGIALFSGGYVGVDVFFVISGYLITSVIYEEIKTDSFSIAKFYERRIKRIFPALFTVIFATWAVFSLFTATVPYFNMLTDSVIASVLFSSNMLFWSETGYFDGFSDYKPLLHTWSLGIEEQFYVFFPLLLLAISKFMKKKYISVIGTVAVFSFILNVWGVRHHQSATFYLLPTRAWELGIGCLIALWGKQINIRRTYMEIASISGLALILFSVFYFDKNTVFPGLWALIPCVGTALIIISGLAPYKTSVTALFEKPLLVTTGKLSYSLYLWHFPIFTMRKYWQPYKPDSFLFSTFFLIVLTVVLAVLSYNFIETPVRKMRITNRKALFAVTLTVMFIFVSAGYVIKIRNGELPWNHPIYMEPDPIKHLPYHDKLNISYSSDRIIGDKTQTPSIALIGDSHAAVASLGIDDIAKKHKTAIFAATIGGLLPIVDFLKTDKLVSYPNVNDLTLSVLAEHKEIKTVFLIGRWELVYGDQVKDGLFKPFQVGNKLITDQTEIREKFKENLYKTISKLAAMHKKVIVFAEVPSFQPYINIFYPPECQTSYAYERERKQMYSDFKDVEKMGADYELIYYYKPLLNKGNYCYTLGKNTLYYDDNHLSTFGSKYLAQKNEQLLVNIFMQSKN